jgi:hypothetical protein
LVGFVKAPQHIVFIASIASEVVLLCKGLNRIVFTVDGGSDDYRMSRLL